MSAGLDSGDDEIQETHEINVTPFIDVMLVLLIVFMIAAPLATVDVAVQLPAASVEPKERPEAPVFITVDETLAIFLGEEEITVDTMKAKLDAATKNSPEEPIFLRADETVDYGDLMQVMNDLRAAGYLNISLVALELDVAGAP